jgi:hypothetical protein
MGDEPVIRFAAGSQKVTITLHAPLQSDPHAFTATVAVHSWRFAVRLVTTIEADELWDLHRTLGELYHKVGHPSRAVWYTEERLYLTLDLTRLGHLSVQVEADMAALSDLTFSFSFGADQTYLPLWMDEIAEAMKQVSQQP